MKTIYTKGNSKKGFRIIEYDSQTKEFIEEGPNFKQIKHNHFNLTGYRKVFEYCKYYDLGPMNVRYIIVCFMNGFDVLEHFTKLNKPWIRLNGMTELKNDFEKYLKS